MKTLILPLVAALLAGVAGASDAWSTNPAEAMQQAAARKTQVSNRFSKRRFRLCDGVPHNDRVICDPFRYCTEGVGWELTVGVGEEDRFT